MEDDWLILIKTFESFILKKKFFFVQTQNSKLKCRLKLPLGDSLLKLSDSLSNINTKQNTRTCYKSLQRIGTKARKNY